MSVLEDYFVGEINQAEGVKREILSDLFRHIVLSNASYKGKRGSSAKPILDVNYPDNHLLDGFEYKPAGCPIIDMIVLNTRNHVKNENFIKLKYILDWVDLIKREILSPSKNIEDLEGWLKENNEDVIDYQDLELTENLLVYGSEGAKRLRTHFKIERNQALIRKFKNQLVDKKCEVCQFSFFERYGELGKNYIEAHHTVELATYEEARETPISELAAVCSNCHKMLHKGGTLLTIEQLKEIIEGVRKKV
jgi:hypothetical protein